MTTAAEPRTLILLRHAKAEPAKPGQSDVDRDLTKRGRRDAEALGRWLHQHGIGCDEVFSSPAIRTVSTLERVASAGCAETDVKVERSLYDATPDAILEVVRGADTDADVVMVVGHAPGIPALASLLADGEGSRQAHERLCEGFPTSGCAVLRYRGHWSDLAYGSAELERFHVPERD